MSGHSKWATTKHKKAVVDAKRAKLFAKLIKNVEVAARVGPRPSDLGQVTDDDPTGARLEARDPLQDRSPQELLRRLSAEETDGRRIHVGEASTDLNEYGIGSTLNEEAELFFALPERFLMLFDMGYVDEDGCKLIVAGRKD